MLFGCCINTLPGDELAHTSYAKELSELGFDYIELPLNRVAALSGEDFARLRGTLEEAGIACRSCNDFMPKEFRIVGEETTDADTLLRYLETAFSRIGREGLGARYAGYGSPWSRNCPEGFSRERAREQIVAFLRLAAQVAARHGVSIVVEHNNHTETNMLSTISEVSEAVLEVNRCNVGILCDYYHLRVASTPAAAVEACGRDIWHTHIARLSARSYLDSLSGEEDYIRSYAAVLKRLNYNGGISIEAVIPDRNSFPRLAEASLRTLRSVFGTA